ncbi:MAG: response regulator [Desulfobacterales bacterium]|nr:response regulator [Desulfobacterales bacterium]
MIRRLIGENIELMWTPGADIWTIKMDPSQIDQILANLCVNARDSIFCIGKIKIETSNVILDEAYCASHREFVPGSYITLTVSDNGCGMNKKVLNKIFEPFFTTKGVGKGTGLGLATIHGMVKQNKGFIDVSSEPGHGSTFKIYLPRYDSKLDQVKQEKSPNCLERGSETVLLVEDEPSTLKITKTILKGLGYNVIAAKTPMEAIQLAKEQEGKIQLLITDVIMPEMDGKDLSAKILSLYPNIKCIFMSGYTDEIISHQNELKKSGHFIQKPFSIEEIASKVRKVLLDVQVF